MVALPEPVHPAAPPSPGISLLHVFPSFRVGGVPLRTVGLINHFGARFRHTILALDNNFEAGSRFTGDVDPMLLPMRHRKGNLLSGVFGCAVSLRRLRPDLLLTYNWGAMEWAMANRLLSVTRHVHLEDGFGSDEADLQLRRRVLFRRWALARCEKLVVPSHQLAALARGVWKLPANRVAYIPNGVDLARFTRLPRDRIPGFARRPGELVIGTVAPLRPEKNIGRLIRTFADLDRSLDVRLVVAGDGGERRALEQSARELGIGDRVVFVGQVTPESVLGAFDIFALSSDTEQMPIALLEAMAAGLPIAAVDVGDVKATVSDDNRPFIVPRDDGPAFTAAFVRLLRDPAKRDELGGNNRARASAEFPQERMFADYEDVFAAGRAG